MRNFLMIAIGLCCMTALGAQTVVPIGQSTSNNLWPFRNPSARYQTGYTAAELGVPAGSQLIELRVQECQQNPPQYQIPAAPTYNNLRVRVAHSTTDPFTGMTGTFDTNYVGTLQDCLGPTNYAPPKVSGFYIFTFTNPFTFNGTQGLVVDWSFDSRSSDGFWINSPGTRRRISNNTGNYQSVTGNLVTSGGDWLIHFVFLTGPGLTVTVTAGAAQPLFSNAQGPGGNGVELCKFDMSSNSQGGVTLTDLELQAVGSVDDSNAFNDLQIYEDTNASGSFDFGQDTAVTTPANFTANDGNIVFPIITAHQNFAASTTRTYFVVGRLAGSALPGQFFDCRVEDITVVGVAGPANKSGVPSTEMKCFTIEAPVFAVVDASQGTPEQAPLGTANVCQEFTIAYPNGPDDKPASLTVTGLGTADELADLVNTELWWDSDTDGSFVAANDTLIDTQTFNADNGNAVFDLTSLPDFMPGQTRRFFVVYNLGTTASHAETFKCYISDIGTGSLGGMASGLPAPNSNGTAGLEVSAGVLIATLNGPTAAATVNSNSQGPSDEGEILCDVTLNAAPGGAWTVTSLTFNAAGTGQFNSAFSELALFETAGTAWTTRAAAAPSAPAASGFTAGAVTYTLTNTAFPPGSTRRFFLLGKLNGTAVSGETFNARLESIVGTPPANGSTVGIPTADSTALMIDASVLTVANAATQPSPVTHRAGTSATVTVAAFRLTATNDVITINGINLTTAGTGDWTSDVDAATGVQVYQDDGDGVFNAADTLLYQGGGAALVTATFGTPLVMPVTSTADLWVRVQLTATAGNGRVATPETFSLSVANAGDVTASTTVLLGTPAPAGVTVGAIEFEVSSFTPANDLPAGGKAISMSGKGFMTPFTVTIDGVVCPGVPNITGGTQVTGLIVPPGGGQNLTIQVNSGTLPTQTLTQTFSYSKVGSVGGSGGDSGGGGCAGTTPSATALLAALLALALGAFGLRRRTT